MLTQYSHNFLIINFNCKYSIKSELLHFFNFNKRKKSIILWNVLLRKHDTVLVF